MDFKNWFNFGVINENTSLQAWIDNNSNLVEGSGQSRYSVEINHRTNIKESLEAFAKICLGYVSAAMKAAGYHVKQVYEEIPIRILVSSRNWDDGEWILMASYNHTHKCFVISKGFYNRDRKTVSVQSNHKCSGDSAADIAKELRNLMHSIKDKPDRHVQKLKPVNLKTGPR